MGANARGGQARKEQFIFYHDAAGLTLFQVPNLLGTIYHTSGDYQTALRCNKDSDQWKQGHQAYGL